ncbi:dihydrodipicolinate synthase family protein [Actinopolymorpha alba]|uniref:dihydrodipicolinate synthase family protein n=1 Tax=Actinopolymorpha alba TaxID=533267 RepID=UPI00035D05E7|nr:dihydrodipicolinate synthase family protein [Actinopolymorpha alba]
MDGEEGLRGILVPIVLPMTPDGEADFDKLRELTSSILESGVNGIWVNGSTGELHSLTAGERAAVVREVADVVRGRGQVVAHVGDTSTRLAIGHAEAAVTAGATHIGAVAPYYASFSPIEIGRHYQELARASTVPLLLYNLPQMVKVGLEHETVLRLAHEGAAVGIKDTGGDFSWYRGLIHQVDAAGLPFRFFMGVESLVDVSLFAGGHGAVCTLVNLIPHTFVGLWQAATRQDWTAVRSHQRDIVALVQALQIPGRTEWIASIAALKWVMTELGQLTSSAVAAPAMPLNAPEQHHLATSALPIAARLNEDRRGHEARKGA